MTVPCGKCILCRIGRTTEWRMRLLHELSFHDKSCFVTLTYSEENYPGQLIKSDLQKFFKRLRKSEPDCKIKYFAVGEYGDDTMRAHYHCIIFGWEPKTIFKNTCIELSELWTLGLHHVGFAEADSCNYVAKYIQKKVTGELAESEYRGRQPPFQLQSQGLGLSYLEKKKEEITKNLVIKYQGKSVSLPRYYLKKLDKDSINPVDLYHKTVLRQEKYYKHFYTEEQRKNHSLYERQMARLEASLRPMKYQERLAKKQEYIREKEKQIVKEEKFIDDFQNIHGLR